MQNQIIVHYVDGKVCKGTTADLLPNKKTFHFKDKDSGVTQEIDTAKLKAIYFVKSFEGNPAYNENNNAERAGFGKKITVHFKDGETLVGYTQGYTPNRDIFIVFPADPNSNNDRIFIVTQATDRVSFI